jgi:hypothetical protein
MSRKQVVTVLGVLCVSAVVFLGAHPRQARAQDPEDVFACSDPYFTCEDDFCVTSPYFRLVGWGGGNIYCSTVKEPPTNPYCQNQWSDISCQSLYMCDYGCVDCVYYYDTEEVMCILSDFPFP